jgi:hypothetical protein
MSGPESYAAVAAALEDGRERGSGNPFVVTTIIK